ncbi:MAG: hypothetical protein JWR63_3736, partial [Conexibacter sp.]|nr:hypothetical protein [Conexibacter sp.]
HSGRRGRSVALATRRVYLPMLPALAAKPAWIKSRTGFAFRATALGRRS